MNIESSVSSFLATKNPKYFTPIYDELKNPLLGFIRKSVSDLDTAQDILSNTFERIYVALVNDKYTPRPNAKFSTWAHACAQNAVRYYIRYYSKTKPSNEIFIKDVYESPAFKEELFKDRMNSYDLVIECLKNDMPSKDHLDIIADRFFLKSHRIQDIAEDLGYSTSNVKYRIMKIKKIIRSKVNYDYGIQS